MAKTLLSFVIPCYRSENTITSVVDEIIATVSAREDAFAFEIILVNDGSPDGVADVIMDLCKQHPEIVFINLSRNFGQHSAVMAGFAKARGEIIVCLDDDGQTPANECLKLVDKLNEGYDIVFAEYKQPKQSLFRILGSRFNTACNRFFFGQPKTLKTTSYYACQRFVVETALQYPNPFPYITGLLLQSVSRTANVRVNHRQRTEGKSGYSLKKLISLWTNGVTAFSIKPLRFAAYLGWATAGGRLCVRAGSPSSAKLVNPGMEAGWASTISVVLALGGVSHRADRCGGGIHRTHLLEHQQKPAVCCAADH